MTTEQLTQELVALGLSAADAGDIAVDAIEHGNPLGVLRSTIPVVLVRDESDATWARGYRLGSHGWRCTAVERGAR